MAYLPNRVQNVLNQGYSFNLGEYISKGFNLFSKNAGMFIGYLIIYFAIAIGLALIPLLGTIAQVLVSGALLAGFYVVAHRTANNDYVAFSNFFDGFKDWVNLFLAALLSGIFAFVALIPAFIYLFSTISMEDFLGMEGDPAAVMSIFTGTRILIFVLLALLVMFVTMLFIYAPLFIVFDKNASLGRYDVECKTCYKTPLRTFLVFHSLDFYFNH